MAERQNKTPEQRAAEALGTAERVYAKAVQKAQEAATAHGAAVETQGKAQARLEYVAAHPDLPEEVRAKYAAHFAPEGPDSPFQVVATQEVGLEDGTRPPA